MSDLRVISFKEYPIDPFKKQKVNITAVCTVCIDEKHLVAYAKKVSEEGRAWWAAANHFVRDGDKNISIEGYLPESRSMDKQIKDLLEVAEKNAQAKKGAPIDDGCPF